MGNTGKVVAVIVSFNPDDALERHVQLLVPQVGAVIVVDNGSDQERSPVLQRIERLSSVEIIKNATNLGIAAALNQGWKRAAQLGAEWLATFDQDSEPTADFIPKMVKGLVDDPSPDSVGVLAPIYLEPNGSNRKIAEQQRVSTPAEVRTTITSGNLVRLKALNECGGFIESFFIDYVDHELCFRLRRAGWRVIQSQQAVLLHRLGRISVHSVMGKAVITTNHSAARRFTMSRNRLWVYREYGMQEFAWMVNDIASWTKEMVKIVLLEDQKIEKIKAVVHGVFTGILTTPAERQTGVS